MYKTEGRGTPFTLTLSTVSEKCFSVASKLYSVKNYCHFLRWALACGHALRQNQWQLQHSYSLVHCAPAEHPTARWTIRTSLMRAPMQIFVQQRNAGLSSLRHSYIKIAMPRGKHISFRKYERMVSLSFCTLWPIPAYLANSLRDWPAVHPSTTCLSVSVHCLPAGLEVLYIW